MTDETPEEKADIEFQERVAIKIDSHIPEAEAIRQAREESTRKRKVGDK